MPANTTAAAKDFLSFVNASPTPFHAVKGVKARLAEAGFQELKVSKLMKWLLLYNANTLSERRENLGHQAAFQAGNTTSLEMDQALSPLPLEKDGSRGTLSP